MHVIQMVLQTLNQSYASFARSLSRILLFFFRFAWQTKFSLPYLLNSTMLALDFRVRVVILL